MEFESRPTANTKFSRKSDPFINMCQSARAIGQILNKITQFFQNLSQFCLKFGEILIKYYPFIYQILHLRRGHSYMRRLILLPMLGIWRHIPVGSLVLSTPPGTQICRPTVTLNSKFPILKT